MPRPTKRRTVEFLPPHDCFKPAGVPMADLEEVRLSIDELEAIRLKDLEGLDHEDCAERMQVSRPTFHRILRSAHAKVASALTEGKAVKIEGGTYRLKGRRRCRKCGNVWRESPEETPAVSCSQCGSENVGPAAPGRGRHRRGRRTKGRGRTPGG